MRVQQQSPWNRLFTGRTYAADVCRKVFQGRRETEGGQNTRMKQERHGLCAGGGGGGVEER